MPEKFEVGDLVTYKWLADEGIPKYKRPMCEVLEVHGSHIVIEKLSGFRGKRKITANADDLIKF